ncbi:MAG: hypothetical protein C0603_01865 [Denitrovibrio sp.]|nr:MAG: hypothetical protein C0603_01865 [Denitrovibrio sp.]
MFKVISGLAVALLISSTSFAITIDEAVDAALKNNFEILASQHKVESSKYNVASAKTPYLPQLDAKYAYVKSSEKAYGTIEDEYSTISLTLGYNLFNGFGDMFNVKAAKSAYSAAKHNTQAIREDITLSVKKAYIDVLAAQDGIVVAEKAIQLLKNQLKDIKLSYEVGYVAKNEVLKVESELASSQQNVISAASAYKVAIFNLEKLTGADIANDEKFATLTDYTGSISDIESLKADMMKNRSEIKYLTELINAQKYSIKANKSKFYPKVNLGAAYNTYGEDFSPSDRGYAYDNETTLSLTVDLNIFDGFNKYNSTKSLQAEKMYMMSMLRNTKASMTLQLKNSVENLDLAHASLKASEKELASAQENYRITQNQFKQKVATNTDLMDARVMLTRAENTYNNAKFNIHRALADIERITEKKL